MHKSTTNEVRDRVLQVTELILLGVRRQDILQYAAKKGWGVRDREIDTYIARAHKEIEASVDKIRDREIAKSIRRKERYLVECTKKGDWWTSSLIQRQIDKMLGLDMPG